MFPTVKNRGSLSAEEEKGREGDDGDGDDRLREADLREERGERLAPEELGVYETFKRF
jgi:hypothetical protein